MDEYLRKKLRAGQALYDAFFTMTQAARAGTMSEDQMTQWTHALTQFQPFSDRAQEHERIMHAVSQSEFYQVARGERGVLRYALHRMGHHYWDVVPSTWARVERDDGDLYYAQDAAEGVA